MSPRLFGSLSPVRPTRRSSPARHQVVRSPSAGRHVGRTVGRNVGRHVGRGRTRAGRRRLGVAAALVALGAAGAGSAMAGRSGAAFAGNPGAAGRVVTATVDDAARVAVSAASVSWWSGAASEQAANGTYGTWRHSAVAIGGTWNDSYDAQRNEWSICPGADWQSWDKPLDVAVGGIYLSRGDTWAAAASGAYDARWAAALTQIRTCWGRRDPSLLYLRFAHEMNLDTSDWAVRGGQESLFVRAITRFSDLRYQILPTAKIVLCTNDGTSSDLGGLDIRKLWPGRDSRHRLIANVYSTDSYNQYPYVTSAAAFTWKIDAYEANGAPLGIERHREFAARMGVPFAISEWGTSGDASSSGGGGDSPVYVRLFNAWVRSHAGNVARPVAGQLLYEIQFNLWTQFELWPVTEQPHTAAAYRALSWGR